MTLVPVLADGPNDPMPNIIVAAIQQYRDSHPAEAAPAAEEAKQAPHPVPSPEEIEEHLDVANAATNSMRAQRGVQ